MMDLAEAREPFRVVALASGSGSNLQALLDDQTNYQIVLVIADRPAALALRRAEDAGVPAISIPLRAARDPDARAAWEAQVASVVEAARPDLIVMTGWMRVMSAAFVERYAGRIVNHHPALLPDDDAPFYTLADGTSIPAIRGAHAVRDALQLGVAVTGCTVHWVTPEVDTGPVLARAEVPILPGDDETSLHERIKRHERRLIVEVVRQLAATPR
jgi:phosphoribosylglycinamide formyltransferase-1